MTGLPQHLDLEQAVLGALLYDNSLLDRLPDLSPAHFYEPLHGRIYAMAQQKIRAGELADAVTLRAQIAADEGFGAVGGAPYLLTLLERSAPLTSDAVAYAQMIGDAARRRAVVLAAQRAIVAAGAPDADPLTALEADLREIAADHADGEAWSRPGGAVAHARAGRARGIATGFRRLDEATGGLLRKSLTVIGGATSMGKSLLGQAIGRNIAARGLGVAEIHLEMDETQIGLRDAAALCFRPEHQGRGAADNPTYLAAMRGALSAEQWARMEAAEAALAALPLHYDARPGRSLAQIEAAARRLFRRMERERITPGALIIDHEGLIPPEPGERFPSLLERATARGEGLLAIGKRLDVPVIALAQLTNDGARADGSERLPVVTDIRYGAALTQAATNVILIHRKAYHDERKPDRLRDDGAVWKRGADRETVLVIDKARTGLRSKVTVYMDVATGAVFEPGGTAHERRSDDMGFEAADWREPQGDSADAGERA